METNEIKNEEMTKESVFDKAKALGKKGLDKVKDGFNYVMENPEECADKAIAGITTAFVLGCAVVGIADAKKARRSVYSRNIGESIELKHKLTNQEKVEIDQRMKNGQTKIEAVREMGLIKK